MNSNTVSRRSFLRTTGQGAATIAALSQAPAVFSAAGSPNDTIGVGHIGLGVRGGSLISEVAGRQLGGGIPGTKVVAVCDVYEPHRQKGVQRSMNPEVKIYQNYKDLLADPAVDVVVIASPDHWHCPMLLDAAAAKKDVYIEKGWTRTIAEAKKMRTAVKENQIVMQLGHQSRGQTAGAHGAELIKQGIIGPVTLVRTGRFENRPLGRNVWRWYGDYNYYDRPNPDDVIQQVDWEQWLGTAPKEPFNMEHFWHWRCYWNFGTGVAGDLLSHEVDFVQYVLDLGIPTTCFTKADNNMLFDGRDVPDTWNSVFHYKHKNCTVSFDCSMNSAFVQAPEFRGKEGRLLFDSIAQSVSTFDVFADPASSKYRDDLDSGKVNPGKPFLTYDPSKVKALPSHMQNFFDCVRSRNKPNCNEDQAFIETATLVMSVQSLMDKREVAWDAEKEEIV
ncbi:MAG: Gfo/Idh/MocA family oxidoreductase [bacterium]|jgi:predicted dehydrogenase|nr:Gfo/Idh/MocA family oxidoreductase [bacterium]